MNFEESIKKFRAFDPINKKFAFVGFDILGETTMFDLCKQYELAHNVRLKITQYTGVNDIEGREVYEGDILGFNNPLTPNFIVMFEDGIFSIYGKFGKMETVKRYFQSMKYSDNVTGKVIGNIYETPQLLD